MSSNLFKYIGVALIILIVATSCEQNSAENTSSRPNGIGTAALPAAEDRKKMPEFTLSSVLEGTIVSSKDIHGKVTLVVFFTTWCSSCIKEMSMLQKYQEDYGPNRIHIIGMTASAKDSPENLGKFIKKLGLKFPILVSDNAVQEGFGGIYAVPTAFLIDKEGNIAQKFVSHLEPENLTTQIDMLLQESKDSAL